jgi:hypothetical protein
MDVKLRNVEGQTEALAAVMVAFWFASEKQGHGVSNGAAVVREGNCFFAYRTKADTIVVVKT